MTVRLSALSPPPGTRIIQGTLVRYACEISGPRSIRSDQYGLILRLIYLDQLTFVPCSIIGR